MPATFNFFRIRRFPPAPSNGAPVVFRRNDRELRGTPAQTTVTYFGSDDEARIEHYVSQHEILKRVEGRLYDGREFHEYYKKNDVHMILRRVDALVLCKSSGEVAKNLIDRLNAEYPVSLRADYLRIDFGRLRSRIEELNGIWISQINQPNIHTLAMFGPQVDHSQLYEALKSIGQAASILIRVTVRGAAIPVILSARGSVTFPQPMAEDEQLDRILAIHDEFLEGGLVEEESKQTAKERKAQEREAAKAEAR